jgi:tryptophan synthase beta chain
MEEVKILLEEKELPKQWYNIAADMPNPLKPPLNPSTKKPISPEDLRPIFPDALIEQEASLERWIDIPEEVLNLYRLWRPTPLHRARALEKYLKTPAKIYYKNEGVSPAGSHKVNTSVAQAYYNKAEGITRLATETGAGQWGSALSMACSFLGMECVVYMVRVSYDQKPYRRYMIETWGGTIHPSPSTKTKSGKKILEADPDTPGSLGIAISEAVEEAVSRDDTKYSLGSVLNHVLLHQTVIGLEAKAQLEKVGEYPDIVIGCCGGGSNFAGISFPFLKDKFNGKDVICIGVEPRACPTLTRGEFSYDFGDASMYTPLLTMYTLGHSFIPPGIHAGGLRYHGMAPLISQLVNDGFIESIAYYQTEVFEAALTFARIEGIIPAPETSHAIKSTIDEAIKCREEGKEKTILFNFSGHGHFDMAAYNNYLSGNLKDFDLPQEDIDRSLEKLKGYPKP